MKKVAFMVLVAILSIGGSGFLLDQILAKQGGIGSISSSIEAIRLRSAHPGMPPDQIAREAAKANKGAIGLMKVLADGAANGLGKKTGEAGTTIHSEEKPLDTYVRVSENRDAMLNRQTGEDGSAKGVKGASQDLGEFSGAQQVHVGATADGREVIGVVRDGSVEDLSAVDRINAMNIPEDLRAKILENYYATGSLPEIVVKESRKPASRTSGDPEDPYNPKNF